MGIQGLKKNIISKLDDCAKKASEAAAAAAIAGAEAAPAAGVPTVDFNLSEIAEKYFARTGKNLRIACDGNALIYWIQKSCSATIFPRPGLEFGGQETVNYDNIRKFFRIFRENHISFTVTIDGPDGTEDFWREAVDRTQTQTNAGAKIWKELWENGVSKNSARAFLSPFSVDTMETYIGKEEDASETQIIYSNRGSGRILQALCERPGEGLSVDDTSATPTDKCFAVLSEDSEFFVFNSRFIPLSNVIFEPIVKVETEEEKAARKAAEAEARKKQKEEEEERKRLHEQKLIENDEVGMQLVTASKKKQKQPKKKAAPAPAPAAAAAPVEETKYKIKVKMFTPKCVEEVLKVDSRLLPLMASLVGNEITGTCASDVCKLFEVAATAQPEGAEGATVPVKAAKNTLNNVIKFIQGRSAELLKVVESGEDLAGHIFGASEENEKIISTVRAGIELYTIPATVENALPASFPEEFRPIYDKGELTSRLLRGLIFDKRIAYRCYVEDQGSYTPKFTSFPPISAQLAPIRDLLFSVLFPAGEKVSTVTLVRNKPAAAAAAAAAATSAENAAEKANEAREYPGNTAVLTAVTVNPLKIRKKGVVDYKGFMAMEGEERLSCLMELLRVPKVKADELGQKRKDGAENVPFECLMAALAAYVVNKTPKGYQAEFPLDEVCVQAIFSYFYDRLQKKPFSKSVVSVKGDDTPYIARAVHLFNFVQEFYITFAAINSVLDEPCGKLPAPGDLFDGVTWQLVFNRVRHDGPVAAAVAWAKGLLPQTPVLIKLMSEKDKKKKAAAAAANAHKLKSKSHLEQEAKKKASTNAFDLLDDDE